MRIAQVAPLAESVPPKLYGGTERVVAWLTDELVELGHDVTLFASGDSVTRGTLVPVWPQALRLGPRTIDPAAAHTSLLEAVAARVEDFDVIHCHMDWLHLPLLCRLGAPCVTTLHIQLGTPGVPALMRRFPEASFISISDNQRRPCPDANWLATVHHGLPRDILRPRFERGDYLAFLGRITPEKGPKAAIEIARASNMPLRMAAKVPRADRHYFEQELAPLIDGEQIQFIGEVDEAGKQQLLAGAAALLFPISWQEPFGLVLIEAMACGTPVIAYREASVPELVDDGISGFVVDNIGEAVAAVSRLHEIDRRGVRAAFERRFTARRMAEEYVCHYKTLISGNVDDIPRIANSTIYATTSSPHPSIA